RRAARTRPPSASCRSSRSRADSWAGGSRAWSQVAEVAEAGLDGLLLLVADHAPVDTGQLAIEQIAQLLRHAVDAILPLARVDVDPKCLPPAGLQVVHQLPGAAAHGRAGDVAAVAGDRDGDPVTGLMSAGGRHQRGA